MTRQPRIVPDDASGRGAAVSVLRSGGIVALPTDTVYGIAVSLDVPDGIQRLFQVKRRPPDKGIALLLASASQVEAIAVPSPASERLAAAFWPGPLTLVLPRRPGIVLPAALTGGAPTVGVRLPDHPAPRELAAAIGPLPTTSANLSGEPDALDAATVVAMLGDGVDLVLDGGRTRGSVPSTVVDCTVEPPVVLREGAIDRAAVLNALKAKP
jgi:L-threonylcarbamoyladenylate synthase